MSRDLISELDQVITLSRKDAKEAENKKREFREHFNYLIVRGLKRGINDFQLESKMNWEKCVPLFWGYFWDNLENYDAENIRKKRKDSKMFKNRLIDYSYGFVMFLAPNFDGQKEVFNKLRMICSGNDFLVKVKRALVSGILVKRGKLYPKYLFSKRESLDKGKDIQEVYEEDQNFQDIVGSIHERISKESSKYLPWKGSIETWIEQILIPSGIEKFKKDYDTRKKVISGIDSDSSEKFDDYEDLGLSRIRRRTDPSEKNEKDPSEILYEKAYVKRYWRTRRKSRNPKLLPDSFAQAYIYFRELLRIFFSISSYPWKRITTALIQFLNWKPSQIVEKLSDQILSEICEELEAEFKHDFRLMDDDIDYMFFPLREDMKKTLDKTISKNDSHYLSLCRKFLGSVVSGIELNKFYGEYEAPTAEQLARKRSACISYWKDDVLDVSKLVELLFNNPDLLSVFMDKDFAVEWMKQQRKKLR